VYGHRQRIAIGRDRDFRRDVDLVFDLVCHFQRVLVRSPYPSVDQQCFRRSRHDSNRPPNLLRSQIRKKNKE
jgi:hypothetical protein